MGKLKLGVKSDEKPTELSIELPAAFHRDLLAYADARARETGTLAVDPARLIVPRLERSIATDRAFAREREKPVPPS
jgi:hypothetical protein